MNFVRFISLVLILGAGQLWAGCEDPGIKSIKVPLHYVEPSEGEFSYRYRLIRASDPSSPTVIVLPGGPGQTSIDLKGMFPLGSIPSTLNRIYTDPRGTGCNQVPELSSKSSVFSTEILARDIIEIIRAEKLERYIIYGASYGTVLATTTAYLIERDGLPKPIAVVLEGVVGRSFENFAAYMDQFSEEWERVRKILPGTWTQRLSQDLLPLGYSAEQWGAFISNQLILGDIPYAPIRGHFLIYLLRVLDRYQELRALGRLDLLTPEEVSALQYINSQMVVHSSGALFRAIACDELWGDWQEGRRLRNGRLESYGPNICKGSGKQNIYDSRRMLITSPIYYFQGPHDPASPLKGALYHFKNQTKAERTFVLVDQASHAPLTAGLKSCATQLWQDITEKNDLSKALMNCPRKVVLSVLPPKS